MIQPLFTLVYVSEQDQDIDLLGLLEQSRDFNRRNEITGMLLHCDGSFMQVLEGPQRAVRDLMSRIERDRRHIGVTTLLEQSICKRAFPDWTMSFRPLSKRQAQMRGFSDFLETAEAPTGGSESDTLALLHSFRQTKISPRRYPTS